LEERDRGLGAFFLPKTENRKPETVLRESNMADKVPVIDEDACIGCAACEEICPEVFQMNESLGFALVVNPGGGDADKIEEAMEACPVHCITWSED
jgi:ferredoxin